MPGEVSIPRFGDSLASFVGDLRAWVFSSQSKAARYFGLSHTTVSRYESGQLTPPPEYVIALAELCEKRLASHATNQGEYCILLLREVNQALQWCYPDHVLFHDWDELVSHVRNSKNAHPVETAASNANVYWGESPDISQFFGREIELAQVEEWATGERCRLITILGIGGVGKTSLATAAAQRMARHFDSMIWYSLRNAPPIEDAARFCVQFLSGQVFQDDLTPPRPGISALLAALRQRRCLLVFDNLESVLDSGEHSGQYRVGYEGYGELFRNAAETDHPSCLILTSREKPAEWIVPDPGGRVRCLNLGAISPAEGKQLLRHSHIRGNEQEWQALVARYSGNPLALKLAADMIGEVFNYEISALLKTTRLTPPGLSALLDQQFARTAPLELEILYWLAVERKPVALEELYQNMIQPRSHDALSRALLTLRRRSLIEKSDYRFTLQNVVLEHATDHLVNRVCEEMYSEQFEVFQRIALLKAEVDDYVRESQARLILGPIVEKLTDRFGRSGVKDRLIHIVGALKTQAPRQPGYAGGNLLNLMLHLGMDMQGADFSDLSIWQAYLRGAFLHRVNFQRADLSRSAFSSLLEGVNAIVLSQDGRYLAIATDRRVQIWQMANFELYTVLEGHDDLVWAVAFSPDGEYLFTGGADHTVRIWDFHHNRLLKILPHPNWIWSIALSPDGAIAACAGEDPSIYLWNTQSGELIRELAGHIGAVRSLAFCPDGKTLASGGHDQTIRFWDIQKGGLQSILKDAGGKILALAFDPSGEHLISGGSDKKLRIWNRKNGDLNATLTGHTDAIASVIVNLNGNLAASASYDGTIRLWDLATRQENKVLRAHNQAVKAVAFNASGQRLISGGYDQTVRFWETETGLLKHTLRGYSLQVKSITFSADGNQLATGSTDYVTRIWDPRSGQVLHTLRGHTRWVAVVKYSPDNAMLASGSYDRTIRLWEARTGRLKRTLQAPNWIRTLDFSPDGSLLAAAGVTSDVWVWDIETGQLLSTLGGHLGGVCKVAFHPSQPLLAASSEENAIRLWNLGSNQLAQLFTSHEAPVSDMVFVDEGQNLVSVDKQGKVRRWNIAGESLEKSWISQVEARQATFSPNGQQMACENDAGRVLVLDTNTGETLCALDVCNEMLSVLAFDARAGLLAGGCQNGVVHLWNIETHNHVQTLMIHRPYEQMDITGATGITASQKDMLIELGAIERR